jgi:D-alanine-D-alanine ligase
MKPNSKILICYNSPVSIFPVYNGKPAKANLGLNKNFQKFDDLSESGFSKEIGKIKKILESYYSDVKVLAVDKNINRVTKEINNYSPDIIFNFVESIEGIASYESCIAGLYELLGFQYTGNTPSTLGNCLNKGRTKNILRSYDIDTPDFIVIKPFQKILPENFKLKLPVILKLLNEDASIGISELSVVNDINSLKRHVNFLSETYNQEIIAEEYIDGREINVAILGGEPLPLSEIEFHGLPEDFPKIVTYDGKWMAGSLYYKYTNPKCPAGLEVNVKKKIEQVALTAYEAMNCRDYARVDIRLDNNNNPYVIEINPNPDISLDSGFARAASAAGITYPELLYTIAGYAVRRKEHDSQTKAG